MSEIMVRAMKATKSPVVVPSREPDLKVGPYFDGSYDKYWFEEMVLEWCTMRDPDKMTPVPYRIKTKDGVLTFFHGLTHVMCKDIQAAYHSWLAEKYLLLGDKND